MIHVGENVIDGIPVTVAKRKAKSLIVRVKAERLPDWRILRKRLNGCSNCGACEKQ